MNGRWSLQLGRMLVVAVLVVGCAQHAPRHTGTPPSTRGVGTEPAPVGVVLREFEFEPRPLKVKAGRVRFLLMNRGSVEHDFMIPKLMGDMEHERDLVQPGQNKTIEVDLKAGVYEAVCTVPGHKDAGMKVIIEVSST